MNRPRRRQVPSRKRWKLFEQTTSETGAFQEAVETFEWAQALWEILKGSDRELVGQKLRNLLEDGQHVISRSEVDPVSWTT